MRSKTSEWFETKIKYDKVQEDGMEKSVIEAYTVDALSFTEAEAKITEEMSQYISGAFFIKSISRAPYSEVFFSDKETDDRWYRAKLAFITIDERTGKEKRSITVYLIQAASLDNAREYVNEVMSKTMIDYDIVSISETPLLDVFEHENQ